MDRYPYAIVWTPLPVISWLVPVIGHTGIADSEGVIYDFGGSYYIARDHMTFGRPTKYLTLAPGHITADDWDAAIEASACRFRERTHNLILNNCHSHVADTLNEMRYKGRDNYTQVDVFLMMTLRSRYVGVCGFLKQWGAFMVIAIVAVILLVYLN